ncbi:hypothetical protein GCM10028799_03390 [Kribbella italica]
MPSAFAVAFGTVTGRAAGFSGVGVNSHFTVGAGRPDGAAGVAEAGVVVSVAASKVVAIRAGTSDRFMRST